MEVELGDAGELLAFGEMVEVHLERAFQRTLRLHPGPVAFVADGHVFEKLAFEFQVRMNVFELDPGRGRQAVPFALRPLQIHPRSASAWSARSRRAKIGRSEDRT